MSNLVIVAIPDENDRVWKVSSEPVPHLTLLFLGEAGQVDNLDKIVQFVEHAASTTLQRFYLPVDRRGELGEDPTLGPADVLFFKKNRYDFKAVTEFRSVLLKDNAIKTAFDSSSQHDGPWLPHLTLGYENRPAKKPANEDDYPFYDVSFTKVAVWDGEYTGPEFLLKDFWDEYDALETVPLDVAMSGIMHHDADPFDQNIALGTAFLAHHGVKGMKWGVRKEEPTGRQSGYQKQKAELHGQNTQGLKVALGGGLALLSPTFRANTTKRTKLMVGAFGNYSILDPAVASDLRQASKKVNLQKADNEWEKGLGNGQAFVAVHNKVADHFNAGIGAVNAKHPDPKGTRDWSNEDYSNPKSSKDPAFKKYATDIHKLTKDSIDKAVADLNLENPSGTKEVKVQQDPQDPLTFKMTVHDKTKVAHAADDQPELTLKVTYKLDAKGMVTGFIINGGSDELAQSALLDQGAVFLEHFGVKGMRWGVRKEDLTTAVNAAKSVGGAVGKAAVAVGTAVGDAQFENKAKDPASHEELQSKIIDKAGEAFRRTDLPAMKNKPEYQKAKKLPHRLLHPTDPATKAYRKEAKETYIKRLEDAANSMTNTSGTRQYTIRERGWELPAEGGALPKSRHYWDVSSREIKHAANGEVTSTVELTLDEDGFITDIQQVPSADAAVAHSTMELGADFIAGLGLNIGSDLEHYGVKGMRWGVRRDPPEAVAPTATSVVPHGQRRKTKIEVEGGHNHDAHPDALKVAEAKAKLKKSGVAALSNQELRDMNQRLQLESQAAQLNSPRAQKFIQRQLEQQGQQAVQLGVRKGGAHVVKKGAKKAGKAAATAATIALI